MPPTVAVPPPPQVDEPIEVAAFAEEAEPAELPQPVEPPKKAEPSVPVVAARAAQKPWVAVAAPPLVEPAESRGFASVLQAFMEESNIRWGELLSGLLIVGSSVGLVISLWATLEKAIPYFPVAVFLVATAAMHGAGLYTLKYWRLKATSRGLLLVSTLLVPLNVLAAIALNDRNLDYGPIDYVAVTVGLAVLAAIVYSAARILNKHNPWPMFLAVVGGAVGSSYIGRLASPGASEGRILLLFALPFASFAAAAVAQVRRLAAGRRLAPRRAAESFRFFGIGLFALVIAAGLLAWKSGNVLGTLSLLAPLVSLLGALLTATGLVVQGRMTRVEEAGYRTAGTAIALGGGLVILAAVVLAWPRPDLLVEVGLLNAFAFAALAWVAGMPELHLFATASFSLACLIGYDLATGEISIGSATSDQLTRLLLEARSALILTILSLVIDGVALALRQTKAVRHAAGYFASAMLHAGVAVAIAAFAIFRDLPDRNLATAVFLLLALRWLSAAWWIRRPYATWFGSGLLLAAIGHGLAMNSAVAAFLDARGLLPADPKTVALLVHATICMAYAAAAAWRAQAVGEPTTRAGGLTPADVRGDQPLGSGTPQTDDLVSLIDFGAERSAYDALVMPLGITALVVSALAVPSMLYVTGVRFFTHAGYAGVIGAIWLAAAFLFESPVLVGVAQVVGTAGVVLGVAGHCRHQDWWTGSLIEPLFLNWQLGALAVWSGLWIGLRQFVRRWPVAVRVLRREPVTVDRIVLGAVVALLAATCLLAVAPGIVAQESLVAQGSGRALPFYLLVVMPFLIGAIATGARAFFGKQGIPAAVACGLGIVAVLCFARVLAVTSDSLWPGFPSPYGQGWGAGAWLALALVAVCVVAAHWERPTRATFGGFAALLATLPFLAACHWDNEASTASALAWGSGLAALAVSLLWSCRGAIGRGSRQLGWKSPDAPAWRDARAVRDALVASTGFTLLAIVAGDMVTLLGRGLETVGPFEGSFFARIGPAAADAVPLLLLAASFVVYAVAERKALWGLSATFLAQCAWGVFAGYAVARADHTPHLADFVRFVQQMGLSAAVAAVCWMAIDRLLGRGRGGAVFAEDEPRLDFGISIQFVLAALFAAGLTVGATAGLWSAPGILMESVKACGSPLGWSLLVLAAGIWCVRQRADWPLSAIVAALGFLAAAAPLAAASLSAWNGPHNWLSFHTAIAGWCGVIGVMVFAAVAFAGRRRVVSEEDTGGPESARGGPAAPGAAQRPPALSRRLVGLVGLVGSGRNGAGLLGIADWTLFLTPVVVLFAIRALWDDPLRPWWSAGPAVWVSLCVLILAAVTAGQRRAFLSLGFAVLGSVMIGLRPWLGLGLSPTPVRQDVLDLIHITLIGSALHALVWSVVTIVHERRRPTDDLPLLFPLSHHVVALIGTIVAALPVLAVVGQRITDIASLAPVDVTPATPLGWTALGLLAALCVLSFGERAARHGLPLLYVLGLATLGISLTRFELSHNEFIVTALCSLAGYVVVTGALWSVRRPLRTAALRWGAAAGDVDADG
ncbi:MAG TPA: hypothetical protein VHY20_14720, partial [Pirellulales bacterium]|nr:hypothetical protein [Pirellulales bacterium]